MACKLVATLAVRDRAHSCTRILIEFVLVGAACKAASLRLPSMCASACLLRIRLCHPWTPTDAWARCCRPWQQPPPAAQPKGSAATRAAGGDRHCHHHHHCHHPRLSCCCGCRAARWHRLQLSGDRERRRLHSQRRGRRSRWRPAAVVQLPTCVHLQSAMCAVALNGSSDALDGVKLSDGTATSRGRWMDERRHVDGGDAMRCDAMQRRIGPLHECTRPRVDLSHARNAAMRMNGGYDELDCHALPAIRFDSIRLDWIALISPSPSESQRPAPRQHG